MDSFKTKKKYLEQYRPRKEEDSSKSLHHLPTIIVKYLPLDVQKVDTMVWISAQASTPVSLLVFPSQNKLNCHAFARFDSLEAAVSASCKLDNKLFRNSPVRAQLTHETRDLIRRSKSVSVDDRRCGITARKTMTTFLEKWKCGDFDCYLDMVQCIAMSNVDPAKKFVLHPSSNLTEAMPFKMRSYVERYAHSSHQIVQSEASPSLSASTSASGEGERTSSPKPAPSSQKPKNSEQSQNAADYHQKNHRAGKEQATVVRRPRHTATEASALSRQGDSNASSTESSAFLESPLNGLAHPPRRVAHRGPFALLSSVASCNRPDRSSSSTVGSGNVPLAVCKTPAPSSSDHGLTTPDDRPVRRPAVGVSVGNSKVQASSSVSSVPAVYCRSAPASGMSSGAEDSNSNLHSRPGVVSYVEGKLMFCESVIDIDNPIDSISGVDLQQSAQNQGHDLQAAEDVVATLSRQHAVCKTQLEAASQVAPRYSSHEQRKLLLAEKKLEEVKVILEEEARDRLQVYKDAAMKCAGDEVSLKWLNQDCKYDELCAEAKLLCYELVALHVKLERCL